jgi:Glyoxalase-like domain
VGDRPAHVRLRQAVLATAELEPVASALQAELGLPEPFRDPGVAQFGLSNAVFALGDCFLEVVSPARAGTAAARYLQRRGGDCGYMVIFDLEDLEGARARAQQLGIRVVWRIDLADISGTHLHPADMHGAIVSLDQSRPYGTWRWGGPQWIGRIGSGAPGRLAGITVAVEHPALTAARWAHVLGVAVSDGPRPALRLDGGEIRFVVAQESSVEGLTEFALELPAELRRGREAIELGGVRMRLLDATGRQRSESRSR